MVAGDIDRFIVTVLETLVHKQESASLHHLDNFVRSINIIHFCPDVLSVPLPIGALMREMENRSVNG